MSTRRDFCKTLGALGVAAATSSLFIPKEIQASPVPKTKIKKSENGLIWAYLIHLGYNMWQDYQGEGYQMDKYPSDFTVNQIRKWAHYYRPELTCDTECWDRIIARMAEQGCNMALIDLGDGVAYETHPEIAVKGAWSPSFLKRMLSKMREVGIEPIPKLNFSACHKAWMGDYQYRISSKGYYSFCRDLIEEVVDIFDHPRLFHLGLDEETWEFQSHLRYAVIRNGDLWWHDLYYLQDIVERLNIRPWIWSDYAWDHSDVFYKKMPKSILQSNWNYEDSAVLFDDNNKPGDIRAQTFLDLEAHGFDQVPTGSLWYKSQWNNFENMDHIIKHGKRIIAPEHLKGFMQTSWMPTLNPCLQVHYDSLDCFADAKRRYF